MNIVQINNIDLVGQRFNGYDLNASLRERGHRATQLVSHKQSNSPFVSEIRPAAAYMRNVDTALSNSLGIYGLINQAAHWIRSHPDFQRADLVHYHLIHNDLLSLLDFPMLAAQKPSVWSVHDPWIATGGCIHPMECDQWRHGCKICDVANTYRLGAPERSDKLFQLKQELYPQLDLDLVVSTDFMLDYLRNSPLTQSFRHIHKIPFGLTDEWLQSTDKKACRNRLDIPVDSFVVAFRDETFSIKGNSFLNAALLSIPPENTVLLTCGSGDSASTLESRFPVHHLGWSNDETAMMDFYGASDVFLMPSLAESFGLMAIEAMASGTPIVVFEDTVLPEVTFAPECGYAVPYKDSGALAAAVLHLKANPQERLRRGERGRALVKQHYRYDDYVRRHVELYEEILARIQT